MRSRQPNASPSLRSIDLRETVQRITCAEKAASPEFQAWLRHKNASGSDIYIGMNPLKPDAATRTKEEIDAIRHVYIDLDYGGENALKEIQKSNLVPKPNFVLTSSPGKFQVVWKVEDITLEDAEALLHALAREFGGDPAATDATRVLRLPGFANKKYDADFYVEAERHSTDTYHLRDFKLHIDGQDSPRQNYHARMKRQSTSERLSPSERDWAFARRALARGDDPEDIVQPATPSECFTYKSTLCCGDLGQTCSATHCACWPSGVSSSSSPA